MPRTWHCPLTLACLALAATGTEAVIKGISYGVSPSAAGVPRANNDFMCADAAAQWNHSGRADLAVISAMGANSIRMYGNDPTLRHREFLDAAHKTGLQVIVGNGDWPYISSPTSCRFHSNFDCREEIQRSYSQNLRNGFLVEGGRYHPALSYIVAVNEPDVKMPSVDEPRLFCKSVISALDGMLEAEKAANVTRESGPLPNFTATFSWLNCRECTDYGMNPSLGQMYQLRDAMLHPEKYDYVPRNNLAELYRTRFVNSFDTAIPSFRIRRMFLDVYEFEFPSTPVFIAEYRWRNPQGDQLRDVSYVLEVAESSPVLQGLVYSSFLQYQDNGGQVEQGIFIPGSEVVANMSYFGTEYGITCLIPAKGADGTTVPSQIARAFGGAPAVFDSTRKCITGQDLEGLGNTTTSTAVETTTTRMTTSSHTGPRQADGGADTVTEPDSGSVSPQVVISGDSRAIPQPESVSDTATRTPRLRRNTRTSTTTSSSPPEHRDLPQSGAGVTTSLGSNTVASGAGSTSAMPTIPMLPSSATVPGAAARSAVTAALALIALVAVS